jgi:excisionase family DNA binding protein
MTISTKEPRGSELRRPTEDESRIALESSRLLGSVLTELGACNGSPDEAIVQVVVQVGGRPTGEPLEIPSAALRLLGDVLTEMARGNAVTLTAIHAELTTQEAADLLQVSRPYLIKLLNEGTLPHRKVGRHRRIRLDDVMAYKRRTDAARAAVLDELVAQAQELGMGY